MSSAYDDVIYELALRIHALVPANPAIMSMTDAFELLDIEEFEYRDLTPGLGQVMAALKRVQKDEIMRYRSVSLQAHEADMRRLLLSVAQEYFEVNMGDPSLEKAGVCFSGICAAVGNQQDVADVSHDYFNAYDLVGVLLHEMCPQDEYSGGYLSPEPDLCETWEQRAWMCLFMAQQLEDPVWVKRRAK